MRMKRRPGSRKRVWRSTKKLGLRKYHWYNWEGYTIEDATKIIYDLERFEDNRDPDRAVANLWVAKNDMSNAIPVSHAIDVLGLPKPENGPMKNFSKLGNTLPFDYHPRQKMYSWLRPALTKKSDVERLYYSEEYRGTRLLPSCSSLDHGGLGDWGLQSA